MNIAGQEFKTVWLKDGDPRPADMLEDDYGMLDKDSGIIYVAVTESPSRNHDTHVHEIVHAALDVSGAKWFLGQVCEKAGMDADFVEETLVRMLTPALVGVVHAT